MKTIEVTTSMSPLAAYAQEEHKEPVILTIRGKPFAALLPIEGFDVETVALSTHPDFMALIERSRARQKVEGGISSAEMRRRLGLVSDQSALQG